MYLAPEALLSVPVQYSARLEQRVLVEITVPVEVPVRHDIVKLSAVGNGQPYYCMALQVLKAY